MTLKNAAYPLGRAELINALRLYHHFTTADGNVGGTTLIDSSLIGSVDFVTGRTIQINSGVANREEQTATAFDPATGTITVDTAFSGQILQLTNYSILAYAAAGGGGGGFASQSLDTIYFDPNNGDTLAHGSDGTPGKPLSTEADVDTQIAAKKLSKVKIVSSEGTGNPGFTLQGTETGISFWGDDSKYVGLALNGKIAIFCDFHFLSLTGQCVAAGFSSAYNCDVGVTDENGWEYYDCTINFYTLGVNVGAQFNRCTFPLGTVITFSDGSTVTLSGTGDVIAADTPNTVWVLGDVRIDGTTGTVAVNDYTIQSNQVKTASTTIDLNQAAATYDLLTGTAGPVELDSLIITMPNAVAGGALTSISIQTDDATPQVLIDNITGGVGNLTAEAQLAWQGRVRLGVGKKVQLTIGGGATGVAYVCNVDMEFKSLAAAGYLA